MKWLSKNGTFAFPVSHPKVVNATAVPDSHESQSAAPPDFHLQAHLEMAAFAAPGSSWHHFT